MHFSSLLLLPAFATAAFHCDGKDFACKFFDANFTIDTVLLESASGVHWTAGDTVTATILVCYCISLPCSAVTSTYLVFVRWLTFVYLFVYLFVAFSAG